MTVPTTMPRVVRDSVIVVGHITRQDWSAVVMSLGALGPIQTPLHSCAEPNLIKFDFGATVDSDGVLVLNLIRQTMQNKTCRVENSTFLYK